MGGPKPFLIFILLGCCPLFLAGQSRSITSGKFTIPRVKGPKLKTACPAFIKKIYPYQGLGIKLGDPFAISYKYYPARKWAVSAELGKFSSRLYNRYYRSLFPTVFPKDIPPVDPPADYINHKVFYDYSFEIKGLRQWNINFISKGLHLYAGLGLQLRSTKISYDYLYLNTVQNFSTARTPFGPVGVLGFEYSHFALPVSAFIEMVWFTDIIADKGYNRMQGGVGLRYIF